MTKKSLFMALAAPAALLASAPLAAGVIAYADRALAIAKTQARAVGYQQIAQTYAGNLQQIQAKATEAQNLLTPLDTNRDGQLSDAEQAAAPKATKERLGQLNNEIEQLEAPITVSKIYVIEQVSNQWDTSVAEVAKKGKIDVIIQPSAILYTGTTLDATDNIANTLDSKITQVAISPPQNWAPRRSSISLYQEVEEILQLDAYLKQQAAAQQGAASQPAAADAGGR